MVGWWDYTKLTRDNDVVDVRRIIIAVLVGLALLLLTWVTFSRRAPGKVPQRAV